MSGDKCACEAVCPPCMGRCGCFYQKNETAFLSTGILIAVVVFAVTAYALLRKKISKMLSGMAR